MNKEEISLYLQNIEEYIFDENKIVTYQWLCKTLDIHVNISKQLLYTYANQESKKGKLGLTYLLAGVPKDRVGYCIVVVKDDNLLEAKKNFQTITSEHVYSVQKLNAISDLNILYTVDISDDHKNNNYKRLTSIDFDSVERDSAVVAVLRAEALQIPSKQPIAALKKPAPKLIEKSPRKQLSPKKKTSPSKQTSPKKKSSDNKGQVKENDNNPTVASMFAKAAANKKPSTASIAAPKAAKDTKPKSKGIGAFFNKAPSKPMDEAIINKNEKKSCIKMEVDEEVPVVPTKQIIKDTEKKTESKKAAEDTIEDKPHVSKNEEISPKSQTKRKNPKQSQPAAKVKESKGKKKTKKSNDEEKVVKKRKRIVVMSDSESSSDEAESDHMEREPTPPPQPTVIEDEDEDIIEGTPQPVSKRHRRRLVDKTYTDSDGFLCTKKEYVTESCSDEEDTKETKKDEMENKEEEKEIKEEEKEIKEEEKEIKEEEKENKEDKKENKEDKKETLKKEDEEKETKPKRKKPKVESAIKTVSKSVSKTVARKQTSPQKKKQTNLMSFFNKK